MPTSEWDIKLTALWSFCMFKLPEDLWALLHRPTLLISAGKGMLIWKNEMLTSEYLQTISLGKSMGQHMECLNDCMNLKIGRLILELEGEIWRSKWNNTIWFGSSLCSTKNGLIIEWILMLLFFFLKKNWLKLIYMLWEFWHIFLNCRLQCLVVVIILQ